MVHEADAHHFVRKEDIVGFNAKVGEGVALYALDQTDYPAANIVVVSRNSCTQQWHTLTACEDDLEFTTTHCFFRFLDADSLCL